MRMAPRLQSSAEKLRQHLLGRSRGRARGTGGASHGASSTASGVGPPSASAAGAAEQLKMLDRELQVR